MSVFGARVTLNRIVLVAVLLVAALKRLHGDLVAGAVAALLATNVVAAAQTSTLAAPPRSTADIAAILEQEKPDAKRIANQQAKANAAVPQTDDPRAKARFYIERAEMRGRLGRVREAIADLDKAVELAESQKAEPLINRARLVQGQLYGWSGETKNALRAFLEIERRSPADRRYNATRWVGILLIELGDLDQAEAAMQRNRDALAAAKKRPGWDADPSRSVAEAHVNFGDAAIFEARGRFAEAAAAYEAAERQFREVLRRAAELPEPPVRSSVEQVIEWMAARAARVKARNGQLAEAEIDVRRALTGWLKLSGKYDLNTARIVRVFSMILLEQGRYAEAEQFAHTVIDIYDGLGAEHDSQVYTGSLGQLAAIQALQGQWTRAAQTYATLEAATKDWEPARRDEVELDITRIFTAYNVNDMQTGVAAARRLLDRQIARFGQRHPETGLARGVLAIGLMRSGHEADALREFESAAPVLISAAREMQGGDDDATGAAAREARLRAVIESYMTLLARSGNKRAAETFQLAELVRGRSVQKALAASGARAVARDPALAELARTEQDLQKQMAAQLGILNNLLATPAAERDAKVIATLQVQLGKLRLEQGRVRTLLAQRFPDYANLVAPQPPSIDEIRAVLNRGESFVSIYLGGKQSFVWAVPKNGPVAFTAVSASAGDIERTVMKLREALALEPTVSTISDIPPFDVKLAYELYAQLLKPIESGWRPAKSLIVATNGALGLLPLGLLPVSPATVDLDVQPYFAGYRAVPWLARSHAVTLVPSAAAFRTLRRLPPGSNKREQLIGFGDPLFSKEQAGERTPPQLASMQGSGVTTRGLPLRRRAAPQTSGVDSAQIAMLPRLPDTADELKSIAHALRTDPSKALRLGKMANETAVKESDLSKYRIIVFATHGLLPDDLDGLQEPALALSAPDVTGLPGDGLLTMGEILALKLDADWVVLSACNTGAGASAGAEAASGLGRAFFYAGTRAVLVTNWSVHSQSARQLVTELFARQTAHPKITRAEALRQAMISLMDGNGYTDETGKTVLTYAHPMFWAPYTIIGDSGGASEWPDRKIKTHSKKSEEK